MEKPDQQDLSKLQESVPRSNIWGTKMTFFFLGVIILTGIAIYFFDNTQPEDMKFLPAQTLAEQKEEPVSTVMLHIGQAETPPYKVEFIDHDTLPPIYSWTDSLIRIRGLGMVPGLELLPHPEGMILRYEATDYMLKRTSRESVLTRLP